MDNSRGGARLRGSFKTFANERVAGDQTGTTEHRTPLLERYINQHSEQFSEEPLVSNVRRSASVTTGVARREIYRDYTGGSFSDQTQEPVTDNRRRSRRFTSWLSRPTRLSRTKEPHREISRPISQGREPYYSDTFEREHPNASQDQLVAPFEDLKLAGKDSNRDMPPNDRRDGQSVLISEEDDDDEGVSCPPSPEDNFIRPERLQRAETVQTNVSDVFSVVTDASSVDSIAQDEHDSCYYSDFDRNSSRRGSASSISERDFALSNPVHTPSTRARGNASVGRGGRSPHWLRVKAQLNRLKQLNIPPMSESLPFTILEEAPEVELSQQEESIPAMSESIPSTILEQAPEVELSQQEGSVPALDTSTLLFDEEAKDGSPCLETPVPEIKIKDENEDDIHLSDDELESTDQHPIYPRAWRDHASHFSPVQHDSESITDASEFSPSECSECAPMASSLDLPATADPSVLFSILIKDMVKYILSNLSNLMDLDAEVQQRPSGSNRETTSESTDSSRSNTTVTQANYQNQRTNGLKRSLSNGDRQGDDDDQRNPNKQRRMGEGPPCAPRNLVVVKKLACPYYKHDPSKCSNTSTCAKSGWDTTHRVKGHLYRTHAQPLHCQRCFKEFSDAKEQAAHARELVACQVIATAPVFEGFDAEQAEKLRSRKALKNKPEAERWKEIYMILFPDAEFIPDPFIDVTETREKQLYRFLDEKLPEKLGEGLIEETQRLNMDRAISGQLKEVLQSGTLNVPIRDILANLFAEFQGERESNFVTPAATIHNAPTAPQFNEAFPSSREISREQEMDTSSLSQQQTHSSIDMIGEETPGTSLHDSDIDPRSQPDLQRLNSFGFLDSMTMEEPEAYHPVEPYASSGIPHFNLTMPSPPVPQTMGMSYPWPGAYDAMPETISPRVLDKRNGQPY